MKRFKVGDLATINKGAERGRLVEVAGLDPPSFCGVKADYTIVACDGGMLSSMRSTLPPAQNRSVKDERLDPIPREKWDNYMEKLKSMGNNPIQTIQLKESN